MALYGFCRPGQRDTAVAPLGPVFLRTAGDDRRQEWSSEMRLGKAKDSAYHDQPDEIELGDGADEHEQCP